MALVIVVPIPTMARADGGISISLPLIVFAAPPEVAVIPETNVYAVPDLDVDIFSTMVGGGVRGKGDGITRGTIVQVGATIETFHLFYRGIPSGWRNDYRDHRWRGHQWNYQRIPHEQVQRNWSNWGKSRHWEAGVGVCLPEMCMNNQIRST